ncbi:MAG: hypothetical protein AVDCRST_MAG08-3159, partial [uncultured Acetobacteraceae bacterium]
CSGVTDGEGVSPWSPCACAPRSAGSPGSACRWPFAAARGASCCRSAWRAWSAWFPCPCGPC